VPKARLSLDKEPELTKDRFEKNAELAGRPGTRAN